MIPRPRAILLIPRLIKNYQSPLPPSQSASESRFKNRCLAPFDFQSLLSRTGFASINHRNFEHTGCRSPGRFASDLESGPDSQACKFHVDHQIVAINTQSGTVGLVRFLATGECFTAQTCWLQYLAFSPRGNPQLRETPIQVLHTTESEQVRKVPFLIV